MVKKITLLIVVLFLLVAIPVTFFVVKQQQEIRQKAAPATTMSLTPAQKTAKVGDTVSLDVNIDTGENSIVAASVYLTFDPVKLQAQSIVNSSQFPNILSSGDISQTGKASIAVGTASISQPFKGIGAVATIKFTVLQQSDTPITVRFGPESFAGSIGEGSTNALIGTTPSSITITADGTGGTTPSPTIATTGTSPSPTGISGTPLPTSAVSTTPTATAVPGQLTVTSPASGTSTSQNPPVISGTAPAGTAITITFYPGTTTGAVTTDSTGHWTFTPASALGVGTYTITVTSTNSVTGATQTTTSTLTITSATSTITPTSTPSPTPTLAEVPVTGSSDMTYLLIGLAIIFILTGAILPFTAR